MHKIAKVLVTGGLLPCEKNVGVLELEYKKDEA